MRSTDVELFCLSGSDYSIKDHRGRSYTVEEAKLLYNSGRVVNYNFALKRLADMGWDIEKLKAHYAGGGR